MSESTVAFSNVLHKVATVLEKTNLYPNKTVLQHTNWVVEVPQETYKMSRGCLLCLLRHQGAAIPIGIFP